ncbi:hypothetical protein [Nocardioides flavescens]|uniref:Uncharacterized protein n=1 Tax=Nocardioides flavescens TaxID=2691959 RepID=A0A6L7EX95_9ACTN|nr:hypothetical protein [Nocardioides flavescens]MXG88679.1 hypothetical protein [Nocardioides flavescens]
MTQTLLAVDAERREWRRVRAVRLAGTALGVGAAVLVAQWGRHGTGLMLAPAAFGLAVLLGTVVSETLARPPHPPGPRSASLTPRRVRDHLPSTTPLVLALVLVLVALLIVTTLSASADESGESRQLACTDPVVTQTHGPYAGAFYSTPLALALLLVLAVAALAAREVVLRPRGVSHSESGADAQRRESVGVVVAATGIAVGAPLVGVLLTTASALGMGSADPTCAPAWWAPTGLATGLLAVTVACGVSLLLGRLMLLPGGRR